MSKIFNSRPSVATVLSLIALFAALGGTSYAAATISGKQIKNSSLTGADIKNNSVGGADVKESKLGQVPSAARAGKATQADNATQAQKATTADSAAQAAKADSVGPDGVDSAAIKPGAVTGGDLGATTLRQNEATVASGETESVIASCQAGERAMSGGTFWTDVPLNLAANAAQLHQVYSRPTGNSWQARGYNNSGDNDAKLVVYVTCLS